MSKHCKPKLSRLVATRLTPADAQRLTVIAESLQWTEAQVQRWCIKHSLPVIEQLRIQAQR